jgi:release factor glutamine methyltransferase
VTVLEIIQRSADFLAKKGVDSPRLTSELLLAHLLNTERLKLYLDFNKVLAPSQVETMRQLVKRRGNREPLQHIVGYACFCGLAIKVTGAVLIPRPETELLAELGWKFLNECSAPRFLDFGTGSGCIAIALAMNCAAATGVAVDKSDAALAIARENATAHNVMDRLEFAIGEDLNRLPPKEKFDLIISNPPYIPTGDITTLQEEVRKFDPKLALDGGKDGLDFYRLLAAQGSPLLRPKGKLMVEFGDGQADPISAILTSHNWIVEKIFDDYSDRQRILSARPN